MLSAAEILSLQEGCPDLRVVSETLLVPFPVRRLANASVVWINDRWFAERGLLSRAGADARSRVHSWLLSTFAITAAAGDSAQRKRFPVITAYADRYGTSSGTSPHGGSGRVATVGCFQVKGVGRTPLVGIGATWTHSHGMMSMREAIHEAIFGEILDAELPFGSVPVVAIIDAGETIPATGDGSIVERRALVVRPAVLRPAHLERAAMFVPLTRETHFAPGTDAKRTHAAIRYLASLDVDGLRQARFPRTLADLCRRYAEQAACGDTLRLFTGGLFSGNLSLDGAVVDFGVARAMDDWASVQLHAHTQGFGQDLARIAAMAQAVRFYAHKAGCEGSAWFSQDIDVKTLREYYSESMKGMFSRIWAAELLDHDSRASIQALMQGYFENQQRIRRRERWDGNPHTGAGWMYGHLVNVQDAHEDAADDSVSALLSSLRKVLRDASSPCRDVLTHCWRSATRHLQPREALNRSSIETALKGILHDCNVMPSAARIGRLIDETVGKSRRCWQNVPAAVGVTAQWVSHGNTVLEGVDAASGHKVYWLEGSNAGNRFIWDDGILDDENIRARQPRAADRRWHCIIETPGSCDAIKRALEAWPHKRYPEPPPRWRDALGCASRG